MSSFHLYIPSMHVRIDSAFIMCGNKVPPSNGFQFERQNILLVCDKYAQQRQWWSCARSHRPWNQLRPTPSLDPAPISVS